MSAPTRVESKGSVWLIDESSKRYCRMPKNEQPRKPDWGGPEAGPLQDLVWHDYIEWGIGSVWWGPSDHLWIRYGEGLDQCLYAPRAQVAGEVMA